MTEIDLSVRFSHIDGTSVKQLLHMLKDVEEEFYENKKIDHQIEWEQEGKSCVSWPLFYLLDKKGTLMNSLLSDDDVLYRRKREIDYSTGPMEWRYSSLAWKSP